MGNYKAIQKVARNRMARRFRMARAFRNLEMEELAAQSGITTDLLQAYEDGKREIPSPVLWHIAAVLKLNINYFLLDVDYFFELAAAAREGSSDE